MTIPHTVHRVWLQGHDQLPDHLAELCDGFDRLHPDWTLQWWDHDRILDELDLGPARPAYLNATDLVPADSVHQLRADIARYAILRQHGGLYIDVDYHWLKPIDQLIDPGPDAIACYEDPGRRWIANGFLATSTGHPLAYALLTGIPDRAKATAGRGLRANAITGPKYLTATVTRLPEVWRPRVLEAWRLHPVPWNQPELADSPENYPTAYAIHTWNHQRQIRGITR